MKRTTKTTAWYTLWELMVVIGFLLMLLNLTFGMFYDLAKFFTRSAEKAIVSQQVMSLSKEWRLFFRGANGDPVVTADNVSISAGSSLVSLKDGVLSFAGEGARSRTRLPRDAVVRFSTEEQAAPPAKLAVLEVRWKEDKHRQSSYRIVAAVP